MAKKTTRASLALAPSELVSKYASANHCDLYCFTGPTYYESCAGFVDLICKKGPKRKHCVLFLATLGGDPDAAFRIMRALRGSYEKVTIAIHGACKSAGTLMAIGASNIVMSRTGEFGPLDIQVRKPDDVFAQNSGLDIFQAIATTTANAFDAFERWTIKLTEDTSGAISTKTAAELASQLSVGLFQPIMAQIDPHRIGEIQRAIRIVQIYASRLGTASLHPGAMSRLVGDYPSHGFVIDLPEAKTLFKNVAEMSAEELELATLFGKELRHYGGKTGSYCDLEEKFPATQGASHGPQSQDERGKSNLSKGIGSSNGSGAHGKPARPVGNPRRARTAPRTGRRAGQAS